MSESIFQLSVFLQGIISIAIIFGSFVAYTQLKHLRQIQSDNLQWNRKIEAQKAIVAKREIRTPLVREHFGSFYKSRSVPIKEIKRKIRDEDGLMSQLHRHLNYYESIARGINLNMYDEDVVRLSFFRSIMVTYQKFSEYIEFRRDQRNPHAYENLIDLVKRWEHLDYSKAVLEELEDHDDDE